MPGQTEQVELLAQRIWSEWLTLGDTMSIAERFGYPMNEYGWATQLDGLKWGDMPENGKDHVRDMAKKEIILVQTTPQTEVTQYLVALLRELKRLHPTRCGATSRSIALDDKRERLVLVVKSRRFRLRPPPEARRPEG